MATLQALSFFPGLARWAQAVDSLYLYGVSTVGSAKSNLPGAFAHVQASSPLGVWMREISSLVDSAPCWDITELARATGGMLAPSSPFGVWVFEMSRKACS